MTRIATALIATAALAMASGAHAQEPENRADARCIVADAYMAGSTTDKELQSVFVAAGIFYMGRINARDPRVDLHSVLVEEFQKLGENQLEKEAERCRADLDQMGRMAKSLSLALNEMAGLPPPAGKGSKATVSSPRGRSKAP